MLSIARENTIIFNDEYLKYQDVIDNIQQRLHRDIKLLDYDSEDLKDALEYAKDRVTLYRFLKDTVFSEDEAVERLVDTIQWRKELKISRMTYQSIANEFFDEGFAFFHKQDLIGRPVAVIQMRHFPKFKDKAKSLSDFMQPFACLVMEIARQLTRDLTRKNELDGVTEDPVLISQISIVIDIAKAPFVPIDSNLMQALKNIVNLRFPGFVGSVYIINFGWMYQGIWQVVKLVLSEQAKARVNFISNEEVRQVIDENDLLTVLGGKDSYNWTLDSDMILDLYATETRFTSLLSTRVSRSSSVSSFTSIGSSAFFDAPDFISRQTSRQYEIIRSTYTSACPSIYGTPGTLTPINSYLTNRQQVVVATSEPRYFLNGFHMGDSFLTSFFRLGSNHNQPNQDTLDGQDLTKRLNELISAKELQQLSEEFGDDEDARDLLYLMNNRQAHFPHMLPDNHPQSIYANSPVKHHILKAEQKMMRLTRKLFHLSFAYKGALYWLLIYLIVRGPVEHSMKKTLQKLMTGTTQQQIAYTTIGVTATIAAALSASFSNSLHTNNYINNNKRSQSSSSGSSSASV